MQKYQAQKTFHSRHASIMAVPRSCFSNHHSLLRQMAAQKQEKHSSKMKTIHNYRRKIKRQTIKSKSEYTSRASPNGPLNIYVRLRCRFAPEKHDRLKTVSGPHTNAICINDSQDNVSAT